MKIVLYTANLATEQEYRMLDANGLQWFSHYGPDGSGFGYLTWRVKRRVGYAYADIGYAYRVRVYKGPWRCLFDGQITRITERTSQDGDEIELWALGWVHVANADTYNHVYCDGRYSQWKSSETPAGHFQPQKFSVDTTDRLLLKPRQGTATDNDFVSAEDYTYLRYTFPFGESAVRFTADYHLALPGSFPAKAQVLAGDVLLWESSASGTGSLNLVATHAATYFEVRLAMTDTGNVTADEDTVYALFENVLAYSVTTLDQKTIADDIVDLLAASYHGLAAATRRIAAPGFALTQAAFDADQTPADILSWACQFGDADGTLLAWGVSFDDARLLFLESYTLDTVRYTLDAAEAESLERAGDWAESAQVVYGVYTDTDGQTQRTADYAAAAAINSLGGHYRRQALSLSNIPTANLAGALLETYLRENGYPKTSGTYTARRVRTPEGLNVPFDELIPGGLVQVREFRALEAEAATADFRDKHTTFMLTGVRVDYAQGVVELLPDADSDEFQRQMTIIEHLAGE